MDADSLWVPKLEKGGKPAYQAIADAIADDIRGGALSPGAKLPPLRTLAEVLGLDFTTVSRAYGEARRRGLVVGKVGQGTFVEAPRANPPRRETAAPALIDMSMNAPPLPDTPGLRERLRQDMAEAAQAFPDRPWHGYGDTAGSQDDRAAGLAWLAGRLPDLSLDRLIVCPGAQGALLALLTTLLRPGDTMVSEELTYPGVKSLAAHLGLTLAGIAMDAEGMRPEAFRAACEQHRPKALYCNPTLHNPSTATLTAQRRAEIVAIARQHGVVIIEDDAYGMLPEDGPPPLAAFAPDLVYHIAGLAKCLSPALRVAFLVTPGQRQTLRMIGAQRATMMAASPLGAAIATRWIGSGLAGDILTAIRAEARLRQRIAAEILPAQFFVGAPEAFHLWLQLPEGWTRSEFAGQLRAQGLLVATSDAFTVGATAPEALRLCLGTLTDVAQTRRVLAQLADLMAQPPGMALSIV